MFREFSAFFNKQYRDQADGGFLITLQQAFLKALRSGYADKQLPNHIFYADDCFVVYRNLGFLKDPDFQEALAAAEVDSVLLGRVWRIWLLAWSMQCRWQSEGLLLDCGTYNGRAFQVALHYSKTRLGDRKDAIVACDLFEDPPDEARKKDHGPNLREKVAKQLGQYGQVQVIQGALPQSLMHAVGSPITWCQIDLNSALADSETFRCVLPKLADGAMVIFDDYGFSRYEETQMELDEIALKLTNSRIMELPTGQGLYVHRR
jgi:hypothetical protein